MTSKISVVSKSAKPTAAASDNVLMEPFFRNREAAFQIKRMQTRAERMKFADAFTEVGCVRCGTKERPHYGCGFCNLCYKWYANILQRVMRARQRDGEQ